MEFMSWENIPQFIWAFADFSITEVGPEVFIINYEYKCSISITLK